MPSLPRVAVILAGGEGRRLWPASTPQRPKQFLRLFGGRTLLEATWERARAVPDLEDVLAVKRAEQLRDLALLGPVEQPHQVPAEHSDAAGGQSREGVGGRTGGPGGRFRCTHTIHGGCSTRDVKFDGPAPPVR